MNKKAQKVKSEQVKKDAPSKEKDLDKELKFLELKEKQIKINSFWIALILVPVISAIVSIITANLTASNQLEKQVLDFKQSAIKEIIVNDNLSDARKKIKYLIDAKLISDEDDSILNALNSFKYESEALDFFLRGTEFINKANQSKGKEEKIENYKKAILQFTKSVDLNPDNHNSLRSIGFAYQKLGFLSTGSDQKSYISSSSDYLSYAIKIKNDEPHYYSLRGTNYMNSKKYELSIKDFNKSIELYPEDAAPYYYLSLVYLLENKIIDATKYMKIAYELNSVEVINNFLADSELYLNSKAEWGCKVYDLVKKNLNKKQMNEIENDNPNLKLTCKKFSD